MIVADIATDPLWDDYRDLAAAAGLAACWSVPILDSDGAVLGTFAIYHRQPDAADEGDGDPRRRSSRRRRWRSRGERAQAALLREKARAEALHRVGQAIASRLDLGEIVQLATDAATELTGASFGAFFYNVIDPAASPTCCTRSRACRARRSRGFPMPRNTAIFAPTFNGEGIVRLDDVLADPRYGRNAPHHGMPEGHLPVRSYLAVPVITADGEVAGGLFFGHATRRASTPSTSSSSRASPRRPPSRSRTRASTARRSGRSRRATARSPTRDRVARVLQESLLPSALPSIPGIDLAARYRACSDGIGGDFYDVFPLPRGSLGDRDR